MGSRGRSRPKVPAKLPPSTSVAALAIFASALFLRALHLWQIRQAPFFDLLFGDARAYDDWARHIASGDVIGTNVFYQAPLYPYFLGALYAIAGPSLWIVRTVQAVLGSAACVCLMLAGRRLFDRRTGIVAGLLLATYAPAIFFDGLIQKSSLDTFLTCLSLYLTTRVVDEPRDRLSWFSLGLATGALCLSRENALVLLPVMAGWLWSDSRLVGPARWRTAMAFAGGVALLLTPVATRNLAVGGGFYLTTSQMGPNLYIGNHVGADGTYQPLRRGRGTAEFERIDATELAERAEGHGLSPADVSSYWTRRALAFAWSDPVAWGRLTIRKALLLVNAVEVVDTESQDSHAEWSWPLRLGAWTGHFGVLVPLALLGAWASRKTLRRAWILPVMMLAYALSVVVFYVLARYRYPLVPLLILLAAVGLVWLAGRARDASRREGVGLAIAVILVAVLSNWPMLSREAMQAVSETNLGVALQAEGRTADALEHYRRAVDLRSNDPVPFVNMGTLLHAEGRTGEAAALFARAIEIQPDFGEAHYFLAKTLLEQGRTPEGIAHLRLALPSMPDSTDVRTTLGVALASRGLFDEAIGTFRDVVQMSPASATARWNLGSALAAAGDFDEAVTELEESVRLDPAHTQARDDLAAARQLRNEQSTPAR